MPLSIFHPLVSGWFQERFGDPTEPQQQGWPAIQSGGNVLISAPTGSGKTLAAFLGAIDSLIQEGASHGLEDATRVIYVSPLKALANDIQKNLLEPLEQIREFAAHSNLEIPEIRPLVRTGDTLPAERQGMRRKPPHILITTPESLFILLTSQSGRDMLRNVRTVIVDEIHAIARDKRGSHLALSLERLEALAGRPLQRIGLSATQKPIEKIARFLTGPDRQAMVVNIGHRRWMDLAIEVPKDELGAVAGNEMWEEIYDRLGQLIEQHRTTLIFVNTRRLSERVTHHLAERLGEESVAAHHGSLSREIRLDAEDRLKKGVLKAVVATASLELGIDIGSVDLVCQVGTPRSIAIALQRVGRAGHWKGAIPKGRLFATTRDELLECAALVRAIRAGELDEVLLPYAPLDVLAQQIVSASAGEECDEEELFQLCRRSAPYAELPREQFDAVTTMLSEGISTRQGRRGAYLHRDRVNGKIRGRRGARLAAITSGGAIPDNANYLVRTHPEDVFVGTVDEDFAVESLSGDIFLLGNASWRIRRVEAGVVRVEDAHGAPPSIPFWRGEAPGRTPELSQAFSKLREDILNCPPEERVSWIQSECGLDRSGAEQAVAYVEAGAAALGVLPTKACVVAERFFDEAGGMQLILHAPFGSRINKAWGLALRKRFCRSFNFELQAAATDNGILLSLGEQHSFPLDSVFSFLSSHTVTELLTQALLAAPLFTVRWRWVASRALAVLRFAQGSKVPPPLQRMRADDLLAAVFPEQAACAENIQGDITVPDHPLVFETVRDCLTEGLDLDSLIEILRDLEGGRIRCVARDTREPSPFSHEILNANPYAFLDDAPLEERRARAVQTRRTLPTQAEDLGALDEQAIARVAEEAWPPLESADEVHDALLTLGLLNEEELAPKVNHKDHQDHKGLCKDRGRLIEELVSQRRAFKLRVARCDQHSAFWVAAERVGLVMTVYPDAVLEPAIDLQELARFSWERDRGLTRENALRELVRYRLESTGPATAVELAGYFSLTEGDVDIALHALEREGQILRGSFRSAERIPEGTTEWCDRRLLARIHRLTLGRLRREIEPVAAADFMRFLFRWQHLAAGTLLHGERGLSVVLEQLEGLEAPAAAWESSILSKRVADYAPEFLDTLCLSGQFAWGRLSLPSALENPEDETSNGSTNGRVGGRVRPSRIAPVAFFRRHEMPHFYALREAGSQGRATGSPLRVEPFNLSHPAREVFEQLERLGACFFDDLVRATRRLPIEVEGGLWELVAAGLVTADGFDNLRALVDPKRRRGEGRHRTRRPRHAIGRWTLLRPPVADGENKDSSQSLETIARLLLRRWGIVFRDLVARETFAPGWRDLLMIYRRMESRGEIRGGRFVNGFLGEQFALPEAVDSLRALRRMGPTDEMITISAADPLNLTGIITPAPRIRPHPDTFISYRDGIPLEDEQLLRIS